MEAEILRLSHCASRCRFASCWHVVLCSLGIFLTKSIYEVQTESHRLCISLSRPQLLYSPLSLADLASWLWLCSETLWWMTPENSSLIIKTCSQTEDVDNARGHLLAYSGCCCYCCVLIHSSKRCAELHMYALMKAQGLACSLRVSSYSRILQMHMTIKGQ